MSDYDRIASAIAFITSCAEDQPSLEEIAAHVHLSPYHFQRLFCRWVGVTPKRYLQILTVEHAKALLSQSKPLLDVSEAIGLSSASRLYDHFVNLEGVTPGEFKSGGMGLNIAYGIHDSPFGKIFIATTPRGICSLSFLTDRDIPNHLAYLTKVWPQANILADQQQTRKLAGAFFDIQRRDDVPLSLHVSGTNFQINVWKALLKIPPGAVASYSDVAQAIGHPNAARAVGLAVAVNPVAFIIPCHRVIRQSGGLGGYRWGDTRKHAIHAWEVARSTTIKSGL